MKVIIAGSRSITDYQIVCEVIKASGYDITEVVSGTAPGVDRLGERWAKEHGVPVKRFPAAWVVDGNFRKNAGYIRNTDMAKYADALIACYDGTSKGTAHMINIMDKLGKLKSIFLVNKK